MAHYIGKYNSIDDVRLDLSTGELAEPYVVAVSGEVYYNGEISAYTNSLAVEDTALDFSSTTIQYTATTDASRIDIYLDGVFETSGTSITGDLGISTNFLASDIHHILKAEYYSGDVLFDTKSITVIQEACPNIAEATYVTTEDNQTLKVKNSGNTTNAYFVDGSTEPQFDYEYTFANAGTHKVQFGFITNKVTNFALADTDMVSFTATTMTAVGNKSLSFNNNLTEIVNLENITSFGDNALAWDPGITSLTFGSGLTSMGYSALQEMHNLQSVTFNPDSQITSIANGMFGNDYALTGVTFPSSVTTHQSSTQYPTFKGCSALTEVRFGANTTTLGAGMFIQGNDSLVTIYSYATTAPTLGGNDFDSITGNTGTLHFPAGSDYSTWIAALGSNWSVEYLPGNYSDINVVSVNYIDGSGTIRVMCLDESNTWSLSAITPGDSTHEVIFTGQTQSGYIEGTGSATIDYIARNLTDSATTYTVDVVIYENGTQVYTRQLTIPINGYVDVGDAIFKNYGDWMSEDYDWSGDIVIEINPQTGFYYKLTDASGNTLLTGDTSTLFTADTISENTGTTTITKNYYVYFYNSPEMSVIWDKRNLYFEQYAAPGIVSFVHTFNVASDGQTFKVTPGREFNKTGGTGKALLDNTETVSFPVSGATNDKYGVYSFPSAGIHTLTYQRQSQDNGIQSWSINSDAVSIDCSSNASWGIHGDSSYSSSVTQCFRNCSSVTGITFDANLNKLGNQVFTGCTSLVSLTFHNPDGINSFYGSAQSQFSTITANNGTLHIPVGSSSAYSDVIAALGSNWTVSDDVVI